MTENDVVKRMVAFFNERGRAVLGSCKASERGVDVAVQWSPTELLYVEAKGLTVRLGRERARSELVWDSGYARLPQLAEGRKRVRMVRRDGTAYLEAPSRPQLVGLAVPDTLYFREHAKFFVERMRREGDGLWFVGEEVDEYLSPERRR